jgi:hypothetical protein
LTAPATPIFSPAAGTYASAQSVTLSDTTNGAAIYYCTSNGASCTPSASSTPFTGAIAVSASETVEAIAVAPGYNNSAVASATYTITLQTQLAVPVISPTSGAVPSGQAVTITAAGGASIYYTTNGTTPSASNGTLYGGALAVTSAETIEAVAVETGYVSSTVASASYTLQAQPALPPSRAGFVQTDDTPGGAAYDQLHQRVYVSNPVAGTVDVISSTTYQILSRIPVPSPQGIDISPNDSTVFIGSGNEEFLGAGPQVAYALDTTSMALTARYLGPPFDATEGAWYPESPLNPIATPDGNALIAINGSIVKWNPSTGQTTTVLSNSSINMSMSSPFSNTPYLIAAHSRDHAKVIVSNDDYPSTVSLYDTSQNAIVTTASFQGYAYSVAANPNGTQFAVAVSGYSASVYLLDVCLNTVATISGGGSLIYSLDGSKLYAVGVIGNVPAVSVLDPSSQQWVGTAPSFAEDIADQSPSTDYEQPMDVDETGRIFGSAVNGLAIDDTADLRNYTGNEGFPSLLFEAAPNDGP